jgi:hypothetical protein
VRAAVVVAEGQRLVTVGPTVRVATAPPAGTVAMVVPPVAEVLPEMQDPVARPRAAPRSR